MNVYARGVQRRQQAQRSAYAALLDTRYGIGMSEYMRLRCGYGVMRECGQHDDPEAVGDAYLATLSLICRLSTFDGPRGVFYRTI